MQRDRPLRILYLTINPNVASTTRGLTSWLQRAPECGLAGVVVAPRKGDLTNWLRHAHVPHIVDAMPWPDWRSPMPAMRSALAVAAWARSQNIDVIHCNEHDVYPFARHLRTLLRRPIVCHVRCQIERSFAEWAFRGSRQPDRLVWNTRWQKADCAAATRHLVPESRQHVIAPGVDHRRFQAGADCRDETRAAWGIQPGEIVVGTASALRPMKQLEDFITAIVTIAKEDPRVVGVIAGEAVAGDEAYAAGLRARMTATGLGRRLQRLGHVDDMAAFHHAVDVCISTSQIESFGNSVAEAMACEKPVVAYAGGAVQEVVGTAGFILEDRDLDGLITHTRRLVSDPQLRAAVGRAGYQRVLANYDPAAIVSSLKILYRSLTDRRPIDSRATPCESPT